MVMMVGLESVVRSVRSVRFLSERYADAPMMTPARSRHLSGRISYRYRADANATDMIEATSGVVGSNAGTLVLLSRDGAVGHI